MFSGGQTDSTGGGALKPSNDHKEQDCTGHESGGASKRPKQTPAEEGTTLPSDVQMGESDKGKPSTAAKPDRGVTGGGALKPSTYAPAMEALNPLKAAIEADDNEPEKEGNH